MSDCTDLNAVYEENLNLGYGTELNDCGETRTKIGIHTFTGERNIMDFGGDNTGVNDNTAALAAAITSLGTHGGRVRFPPGLYAGNFLLDQDSIEIVGSQDDYNELEVGLCPFDPAQPVVTVGDGINLVTGVKIGKFLIRPKTGVAANYGVKIAGADRCRYNRLAIRGFDLYQLYITSTATQYTAYQYFSNVDLACKNLAGSRGLVFEYGAQFTTAIFVTQSNFSSTGASSHIIDMGATCRLNITNCWIEGGNNRGLRFRANTSRIFGINTQVDSSNSADVLVNCDFDGLLTQVIAGNLIIDGLANFTSGNTALLSDKAYFPYRSFYLWPHIQGVLGFEDFTAALNAQHSDVDPAQNIYRDGTVLLVRSTDGSVRIVTKSAATGGIVDISAGAFQIQASAIAGTGLVLGSGSQATVGAAGAAAAVPATAAGYLRFFLGATEYVIPYFAKA